MVKSFVTFTTLRALFGWRRSFAYSVLLLLACSSTVEEITTCPSPQGQKVASFFRVYGGGAAGWQVLRVSIRRAGEPLKPDVFVFEMKHGYDTRLEWLSEDRLLVGYPNNASVESTTTSALGVEIAFKALPSREGTFTEPSTRGCVGSSSDEEL